jgi:hypothetical protein
LLIVDEYTDFAWSMFLKTKDEQYDQITTFIKHMQQRQTPVRKIRCDNSGENQSLQQQLTNSDHHISLNSPLHRRLNKMGGWKGNFLFCIAI